MQYSHTIIFIFGQGHDHFPITFKRLIESCDLQEVDHVTKPALTSPATTPTSAEEVFCWMTKISLVSYFIFASENWLNFSTQYESQGCHWTWVGFVFMYQFKLKWHTITSTLQSPVNCHFIINK